MKKQKMFFTVDTRKMFSLGSIRLKDGRPVEEGTWWWEITFLFLEVTWGYIMVEEGA